MGDRPATTPATDGKERVPAGRGEGLGAHARAARVRDTLHSLANPPRRARAGGTDRRREARLDDPGATTRASIPDARQGLEVRRRACGRATRGHEGDPRGKPRATAKGSAGGEAACNCEGIRGRGHARLRKKPAVPRIGVVAGTGRAAVLLSAEIWRALVPHEGPQLVYQRLSSRNRDPSAPPPDARHLRTSGVAQQSRFGEQHPAFSATGAQRSRSGEHWGGVGRRRAEEPAVPSGGWRQVAVPSAGHTGRSRQAAADEARAVLTKPSPPRKPRYMERPTPSAENGAAR